jgi:hypothetical protein
MIKTVKSSNRLGSSPLDSGKAREKFKCVWELYLIWRAEHALLHHRGSVSTSNSVSQTLGSAHFQLLAKVEAAAREMLRTHLPRHIPFEFVMALLESTANTTDRFMRADQNGASDYRKLAFDVLWSGLSQKARTGSRTRPRVVRARETDSALIDNRPLNSLTSEKMRTGHRI